MQLDLIEFVDVSGSHKESKLPIECYDVCGSQALVPLNTQRNIFQYAPAFLLWPDGPRSWAPRIRITFVDFRGHDFSSCAFFLSWVLARAGPFIIAPYSLLGPDGPSSWGPLSRFTFTDFRRRDLLVSGAYLFKGLWLVLAHGSLHPLSCWGLLVALKASNLMPEGSYY